LIVFLADAVFASSQAGLALLSVFHLAYEGWHRVQIDPPHQAFHGWLERQDEITRSEVELAVEIGEERDVLEIPPDLSIRIGDVGAPDWAADPPRLPLKEALRLLSKPLRLVVENRHNDGAFLRAVGLLPWRRRLQQALDKGWIEVEHGGGSDTRTRLQAADREEALRLWALFDSDAREPGRPSPVSEALSETCRRKGISHHRLARRAIENYLPVKALQAWAHGSAGNLRASRRRTADAFASMAPGQRHHYNMKHGFQGDQKSTIPPLYATFKDHRDLQQGFGRDIASLFQQQLFAIREEWLVKDGQQPETVSMLQSILRRL
jgi:hypothetical protein